MIELKIDDFREGKVTFHISRQDKEDYEKLKGVFVPFTLSDGEKYWLYSGCFPEFYFEGKQFFVRGEDSIMDNRKIIVEFTEFLKIFELLKAYNKIS